ncbi:hypothetical protein D5R40_17765 [Okeania hirsuta]|uniref:Uncharacterized protein n=1 Tax=Okeania hirsuta TaxID=1458930 RepID=A0A3N6RM15_9CYAN|nr:hypothetical protein D5R40_17765 [Okeania hirsuta]
MWVKNLTPQPPSLQGKGGHFFPLLAGEGSGERSSGIVKLTHIFKLDALVGWVEGRNPTPLTQNQ